MPDPVLRTERLVLRPLTPDLARRLLEDDGLPEDDGVSEDDGPGLRCAPGFPREDDRSVCAGILASGEHAAGTWLVLHHGQLVGTLGAAGPVSPDGDQEVGYGLVPAARGAGLGLEAVAAVCAVLERRPGVRRLTAEVLSGNAPSLRLLHRLGFVEIDGGHQPHVRLARPAPGQPALQRRIPGRHVC